MMDKIRNLMDKIRTSFEHFMVGRNGVDDLNQFLLIVFFVLFILELFLGGTIGSICNILSLIVLILLYFRMFSKNIYARSEENSKYIDLKARITGGRRSSGGRSRSSDPDHKIFNCPQCGQKVRVPRGRGRIQIRCPKCGRQFIKRT